MTIDNFNVTSSQGKNSMYSMYRNYRMNAVKAHKNNHTIKFTIKAQYYVVLIIIK